MLVRLVKPFSLYKRTRYNLDNEQTSINQHIPYYTTFQLLDILK